MGHESGESEGASGVWWVCPTSNPEKKSEGREEERHGSRVHAREEREYERGGAKGGAWRGSFTLGPGQQQQVTSQVAKQPRSRLPRCYLKLMKSATPGITKTKTKTGKIS